MRGSDLGKVDTLIDIGQDYKYKAKNLFGNFADAEAIALPKVPSRAVL